jgi:transposase InsO family protein
MANFSWNIFHNDPNDLHRREYILHSPCSLFLPKIALHYIKRYFSRVKTPKDNPECERFNETLEYEWLYNGNLDLDPDKFNPELTGWLIEYNFNRPHQSLEYLTPIEYTEKELKRIRAPDKVLPM